MKKNNKEISTVQTTHRVNKVWAVLRTLKIKRNAVLVNWIGPNSCAVGGAYYTDAEGKWLVPILINFRVLKLGQSQSPSIEAKLRLGLS